MWVLHLYHQPTANKGSVPLPPASQHGIQPITTGNPAQLIPASNQSLLLSHSQQPFSGLNSDSHKLTLFRAILECLLMITSGLLTIPLGRYETMTHHQAADTNIIKQQFLDHQAAVQANQLQLY